MAQISEELLAQVQEARGVQQQIQFELGGLALAEEDIRVKRAELMSQIKETVTAIQEVMKQVKEEYGDGSVNIETGEFTPSESPELKVKK